MKIQKVRLSIYRNNRRPSAEAHLGLFETSRLRHFVAIFDVSSKMLINFVKQSKVWTLSWIMVPQHWLFCALLWKPGEIRTITVDETISVKSVRTRSFSGPYFPAFGLNMDQMNSEYQHLLYSKWWKELTCHNWDFWTIYN